MDHGIESQLRANLAALQPKHPQYATEAVDLILAEARERGASDVHLQPGDEGMAIRWRIDGVLRHVATLPTSIAANLVARLKVLANLLTYRSDTPQEGRIRSIPGAVELRVSTFPTLHGEKAVVRLFAGSGRYETLDEVGLPGEVESTLSRLLDETSGMILLTGPAGGGKTTTIYACLRELARRTQGARSLATLEDPVEVAVPGVAQSQVNPAAGFDLAGGLRSLMRQDPEVIAIGEIRDRPTAEGAFNASLTGHLVLSTFHAGSAAGAIGRLADMGIEPYILRSGLLAVVAQRLVRKLCPACRRPTSGIERALGLDIDPVFEPSGCGECGGTGYRGRTLLAEILDPRHSKTGQSILHREDITGIERAAVADGMITRWDRAREAVREGITSPAEIRRVLGFQDRRGDA